jgi:hypothetical protein
MIYETDAFRVRKPDGTYDYLSATCVYVEPGQDLQAAACRFLRCRREDLVPGAPSAPRFRRPARDRRRAHDDLEAHRQGDPARSPPNSTVESGSGRRDDPVRQGIRARWKAKAMGQLPTDARDATQGRQRTAEAWAIHPRGDPMVTSRVLPVRTKAREAGCAGG